MYAFEYHRPSSSKEALDLAAKKSEGRFLAGGQSLVQAMKLRLSSPSDLIDLNAVADLKTLKVEGSTVAVGAMVRHAEVAGSSAVQKAIPALAELAGMIGDRQVRHMGTLGGSLANSDPAADYPAAVLGLGASVITTQREIAADDYFQGMFATALDPREVIVRIVFPLPKRAAYAKFPHPASGYAMAGVFIAETAQGVRVAVTGAGPGVFRWQEAEAALATNMSAAALDGLAVSAEDLNEDIHATREYRANLVAVMARRAAAKIAEK